MFENEKLKNLPNELKLNALFCGWRLTENGKIPFDLVTDRLARSNDPKTFVSYPTLLHYCNKYLTDDSKNSGIGLGIFKGFSAVDIDHCIDENGELSEIARDIINYCDSYTEFSPSGKGIRIIFKTTSNLDKNNYYIKNSNLGLEIYISDNTNKFVTLTGNKISGDEVKNIDIKPILDKYMKRPIVISDFKEVQETKYEGNVDLERIFEKDLKFKELWYKMAPGSGSNESELDLSLCNKLAYYFRKDFSRIKDAFMSSPYYKSKDEKHKIKWNNGYGDNTIRSAIQFVKLPESYIKNEPVEVHNDVEVIRTNYELTDTGNAQRFIDTSKGMFKYDTDKKLWMIWNGQYWETDTLEKIRNYVNVLAEQMRKECYKIDDMNTKARVLKNIDKISNSAGKDSLLKEARCLPGVAASSADFDNNPYLFCFKNGVLDLKEGIIRDGKKEDMISQIGGSDIDTSGKKPEKFLKFINDLCENDISKTNFLQRWFGYCLTDSSDEQKLLIIQSDGNSGKSLLFDIINEAMGSYGITADSDLITDTQYKGSNAEQIARLKGKRFVYIDEVEENSFLKEKLVKDLTSGFGKMVGRFLYANSMEFAFKGKINITTNYEPRIKGVDKGVWRRVILIKSGFDATGKENKKLREELMEELPQICNWIYEGFKLYNESGLMIPESSKNSVEEYQSTNDILQNWINECCLEDKDAITPSLELFQSFNEYLKLNNYKAFNLTMFGRQMNKKPYKKSMYAGKTVYQGIKISNDYSKAVRDARFKNIKVDKDI